MEKYKFIPAPVVFREPILRYIIVLKGKIFPIGYLEEDIGGVMIYIFKKKYRDQSDDIFKSYINKSSTV